MQLARPTLRDNVTLECSCFCLFKYCIQLKLNTYRFYQATIFLTLCYTWGVTALEFIKNMKAQYIEAQLGRSCYYYYYY